jgi:hypothetical protein
MFTQFTNTTLQSLQHYCTYSLLLYSIHLHCLTSQLSVTFTDYHTLSCTQSLHFTLRNPRRELTLRMHFLRLLLDNSVVGLLNELSRRAASWKRLLHSHSGNWTELANSFGYIAELCQWSSTSGHCVVQQYCYVTSPIPLSVWRDCGLSPGSHVNTCDVIAPAVQQRSVWHGANTASPCVAEHEFIRESFSRRLPSCALLRSPTMGWHVTIYIHIQGGSYFSQAVHRSAFHSDWCTAVCKAHTNFAGESIGLWPVMFGMKYTIQRSQNLLKMLSPYA